MLFVLFTELITCHYVLRASNSALSPWWLNNRQQPLLISVLVGLIRLLCSLLYPSSVLAGLIQLLCSLLYPSSVLVGLIRLLCSLLYPSSLERRWSSRTFRYGYLVTTSPQLSVPPSAAPSFRLGHWLRALLTPMVWRAVCTRPGNVFTAAFWSAITSDSSFM